MPWCLDGQRKTAFGNGAGAVCFTVLDGIDNNKPLASDKIGTSGVFDRAYRCRDEGPSVLSTSSHIVSAATMAIEKQSSNGVQVGVIKERNEF